MRRMKKKYISVIVAIDEKENIKKIKKGFSSILNQTYKEIEIITVIKELSSAKESIFTSHIN